MHYLAVCCIARDEDPFFKEWLAYHSLLGVEHFYIYDHCSKTPVKKLLGNYIDDSRVTIRRIKGNCMQIPAYDDCLKSFGAQCRWIGFLDLDEFALPMGDNDLRVLLSEYEDYGGLAATWHMFNSSGHLKRPGGLVLKNYTEAFSRQESFYIKCFVQPERTLQALSPHHFGFRQGFYCVNEDHYPVAPDTHCTFSAGKKIRINHYFMRSQQDFEEKLARGRADVDDPKQAHQLEYFYEGTAKPYVKDIEIQRFLLQLEKAVAGRTLPSPALCFAKDLNYEKLMETAVSFMQAGQHEKAEICLCQAADEIRENADYWALRAILAEARGNLERAELFLRQSLRRSSTQTAHLQLARLFRTKGRTNLAEGIDTTLRRYPSFFQ